MKLQKRVSRKNLRVLTDVTKNPRRIGIFQELHTSSKKAPRNTDTHVQQLATWFYPHQGRGA